MALFGLLAAPLGADATPSAAGLWHGQIVYQPAEIELEATVEIGPDAEGRLRGVIGIPSQHILYLPLSEVALEGRSLALTFHWLSETRGPDAPFFLRGELSADGTSYAGEFVANDGIRPFRLQRMGPPGTPWPEVEDPPPLADLSTSLGELRDAFNAESGSVRLVLLLSPT